MVIIIVAVVLGAFFIYPMISKGEEVNPNDGTALTTIPTIKKIQERPLFIKNPKTNNNCNIPPKTRKQRFNSWIIIFMDWKKT